MPFVLKPHQPIAGEIEEISGAVIVPATRPRSWAVEGGVFDAQGRPVPLADCWHYPNSAATIPPACPPEPRVLPLKRGRYLFGGIYMEQFGHFLLESTSRLWALDHLAGKLDGIVLLTQPGTDRRRVERGISTFLRLVGAPDLPLLWTAGPVRVGSLVVPKQGIGALDLMLGSPEYRAFIARRFARDVAPEGPERLYISRTRIRSAHGSLIGEDVLEDHLAREGFTVFHPQEHPVETQIARYKAARVVMGVDGSPFHLMALVARPDQRIVLFQRRPAPEAFLMADQLRLFGGPDVHVVEVEPQGWSPAGVRRAALSVYGVTRFSQAWRDLKRAGLLRGDVPWPDMTRDEVRDRIRAVGEGIGADMCEVLRPATNLQDVPRRADADRIRLFREPQWRERSLAARGRA